MDNMSPKNYFLAVLHSVKIYKSFQFFRDFLPLWYRYLTCNSDVFLNFDVRFRSLSVVTKLKKKGIFIHDDKFAHSLSSELVYPVKLFAAFHCQRLTHRALLVVLKPCNDIK